MAASEKKEDRTAPVLILIFLALAAGIILAGYLYFTNYAKHYRSEVERQLSAIADLKVAELQDWRRERLGDAQVFYRNDVFSRLVRHHLENPGDEKVNQDLRSWLGKYQAYYQYDRIMLLDARYRKIFLIPGKPERGNSFVSPSSSRLLKSGKIAFEDFYWNEHDQKMYLKILVPVVEGRGSSRILAVLAFRIDPDTYLHPYISNWPTVSRTAETLLVRREGNDVVFLNELRFRKNTPLKLRFPLEKKELPAVQAVLGRQGIFEGRDYRDEPVIAAVRAVPDSPWFLSARMDVAEVYAPMRERLWLMITVVAALLVGVGASTGFLWRHQRARHYREKYEASEALRESEEKYRSFFENSLDAVLLTTPDGSILAANDAACRMFGKTEKEICEGGREGVVDMSDPRLEAALAERAGKGLFKGEMTFVRSDGTRFPGELSSAIFKDREGHERTSMIIRDITERRRAEEQRIASEARYKELFDSSGTSIAIIDEHGKYLMVNDKAAKGYGKSPEEVIGKSMFDFLPEPTARKNLEENKRLIETGGRREYEDSFMLPGGKKTFFIVDQCLKDDTGRYFAVQSSAIDITERKRTAEALRQSEENFRRSLDESPLGVRIVTVDGETLYANRALLDICGYDSIEELINTPVKKRYTPESYLGFQKRREQRQNGLDDPSEYVISIIRKDGGVRHLQVFRKEILWDGKSEYQALYLDITDRKKAEDALRESEEQFRLLAEQSLMAIGIIQDGVFKYINKAFEQINGYSADEMKRWKFLEFSDTIHPDDRDFVMDQIIKKQSGRTDVVPHYFFRIIHKTGGIRWIEIYSQTVLYQKKPADLITLIDVTERRKAEEALQESERKYRDVFDSIMEGIFRTTPEGRFVIVNPAFASICGYASPEEMLEKVTDIPNQLYANPEDRLRFQKHMASEGKIQGFEIQFKHPAKGLIWVSFHAKAIRDKKGVIRNYEGIIEDITARRKAEDELRRSHAQMRALAERLQQIREESQIAIAREIHDELGGGLTGVKMVLSLLSQKIQEEEDVKAPGILMKRINAANRLIDDLIRNVRRIGTKLRPSVLDDLGLVAALEWESEEFANRTGIPCEFVPAFEYVTLEEATATAVFRIFQEALTNVSRHSGADKVTVLFREDGGYLYLEVMDNGRGITEGEILNMKSLGILGMRERALVFGGELSISGKPGGGTTMVLKIPRGRERVEPS